MDRCPLCESFVLVAEDKPCYLCGLSLIEAANETTVAVVPGWFLFDPARPGFADSVLNRLLRIAENLMLDFSQVSFLSSAGIRVLVNLNTAVQENGLKLVLANVRPQVIEIFRICRMSKVFRIVDDVDEGLNSF